MHGTTECIPENIRLFQFYSQADEELCQYRFFAVIRQTFLIKSFVSFLVLSSKKLIRLIIGLGKSLLSWFWTENNFYFAS